MKKPAKHTPGPWQATSFRGNISIQNRACQVGNVIGTDAQAQADAALIAAAPDLLALLVEAANMIRHGFGPIQAGSTADSLLIDCAVTIAKAKATGGAQ